MSAYSQKGSSGTLVNRFLGIDFVTFQFWMGIVILITGLSTLDSSDARIVLGMVVTGNAMTLREIRRSSLMVTKKAKE